jgi:hypothetical protein
MSQQQEEQLETRHWDGQRGSLNVFGETAGQNQF